MPRAPKGWAWASCIIDSGSSVDSFQNPSVLTAPRPSRRTVQVANGDTVRLQLEGLARIHTYDVAGRPTTVGIPDAVSDSRLKSLLSLGRTQRRGINVNTDDERPYIELVSGRRGAYLCVATVTCATLISLCPLTVVAASRRPSLTLHYLLARLPVRRKHIIPRRAHASSC